MSDFKLVGNSKSSKHILQMNSPNMNCSQQKLPDHEKIPMRSELRIAVIIAVLAFLFSYTESDGATPNSKRNTPALQPEMELANLASESLRAGLQAGSIWEEIGFGVIIKAEEAAPFFPMKDKERVRIYLKPPARGMAVDTVGMVDVWFNLVVFEGPRKKSNQNSGDRPSTSTKKPLLTPLPNRTDDRFFDALQTREEEKIRLAKNGAPQASKACWISYRPISTEILPELIASLQKFEDWSKTAAENGVKNFSKPLFDCNSWNSPTSNRLRPDDLLQLIFFVDDSGEAFLRLKYLDAHPRDKDAGFFGYDSNSWKGITEEMRSDLRDRVGHTDLLRRRHDLIFPASRVPILLKVLVNLKEEVTTSAKDAMAYAKGKMEKESKVDLLFK